MNRPPPTHNLGYHNYFTLERIPPCAPCLILAFALQDFDDNAPIPKNCTCRNLRPPGLTYADPKLFEPSTTPGASLKDIGTDKTKEWPYENWNTLVFDFIRRTSDMGLLIQHMPYIAHAIMNVDLPTDIKILLDLKGFGKNNTELLVFTHMHLQAAADVVLPPLSQHMQTATHRLLTLKTTTNLENSCKRLPPRPNIPDFP
jgi:hypothetical protein